MGEGKVTVSRMQAASRAYRAFIEGLSPTTVRRLDELAAPGMHYRDPFHDTHGIEAAKRVMARIFREVDDPRYMVTHAALDGDTCFFRWKFTCRPRHYGRGQPWIIDGITEVRFNDQGKAVEHVDYWDAGHYVYERLPLFGYLIRFIRKRMSLVV
jgi:steroid delta-isomerase